MNFNGDAPAGFAPNLLRAALATHTRQVKGRIKRVIGTLIYASVPNARLGEICALRDVDSGIVTYAEIVGFDDTVAMLSPLHTIAGLSTLTEVTATGRSLEVAVGDALLGRVLDGYGRALDSDEKGDLPTMEMRSLHRAAPPALSRHVIKRRFSLGVRAIDGLLTCGEGQRVGIYGPPGAGKSLLLAQILQTAEADVRVLALVGERGREVREFLERHLTAESRARAVIVVATSDRSSVERLKAAQTAMTIAEYFRDRGSKVLLVVDSVTRLARAIREIGLAAGEPPTRRGFPPSVFTSLPMLFERAGMAQNGSITALFTVLSEGDAATDPISEETRSLLDGHIVLTSKLAQSGHFPAIDVNASLSRVMIDVVATEHNAAAQKIRRLLSKYAEVEFLIQVGEYKPGNDELADEAVRKHGAIASFLRQPFHERARLEDSVALVQSLAE
ncbi:MAG: FliI/YscN family ATPase [Hyphomicrobiales bacterium]|nr:FliI/YscN family ATPase [Hyphomicrobiales bacterium]